MMRRGAPFKGGTLFQRFPVCALVLVVCGPGRAESVEVERPEVYEVGVNAAVAALSPELRPFFSAHLERLGHVAGSHCCKPSGPRTDAGLCVEHHVWLDVAADTDEVSALRQAAFEFPRDRQRAVALFVRRLGTDAAVDGGGLPWAVQSSYEALVRAFRARRSAAIVQAGGTLLHFCIDAGLPFNATRLGGGASSNTTGDASRRCRAVHRTRYHVDLTGVLLPRFAEEMRIWPARCRPTADTMGVVFDTMRTAHHWAVTLVAMEESVFGGGFRGGSDRCRRLTSTESNRLASFAAPILEDRLEAGALLGATLITSAWIEARRPRLPLVEAVAAADGEVPAVTSELVGSRNSTVVHGGECAHAARIKPENRVRFRSAEEAREAGRTPCKNCAPFEP